MLFHSFKKLIKYFLKIEVANSLQTKTHITNYHKSSYGPETEPFPASRVHVSTFPHCSSIADVFRVDSP